MDVFVYGTLTDPETAGSVLDAFEYVGDARLSGLHRVDGTYPTLSPGGSVAGRLLRTDEIAALDRYEGVRPDETESLYVRVTVPRVDGGTVETYVGDPDRLDAPASWSGDGPFPRRVRDYLSTAEVTVSVDP